MEGAEPDPREAIVARREEIATGPHPRPLYDPPVPDESDDEVYRLYRDEWVIAYTAVATPGGYAPGELAGACRNHFDQRYTGRVPAHCARVDLVGADTTGVARLLLLLPVMKGEFKHRHLADTFAVEQGWADYAIVVRNSAADHDLRSYGTKKLPYQTP